MPRRMSDPSYEYRPWSPERRRRASETAKARIARGRRPVPAPQKLKILGPKILVLLAQKRAMIRAWEEELAEERRSLADLETAVRVLERYGLL
jgi:hypothetical protein